MIRTSDKFIFLAVAISFIVSAYLWFSGNHIEGIFTAIWVPSILSFAVYFKVMAVLEYQRISKNNLKDFENNFEDK